MKIVNLTPHDIILILPRGIQRTFKSKGVVHVENQKYYIGLQISGHRILRRKQYQVYGLPRPKDRTIFIVSRVAAERIWAKDNRTDVFALTGRHVDRHGRLVGFRCLEANPYTDKIEIPGVNFEKEQGAKTP